MPKYVEENQAANARLKQLAGKLSAEKLGAKLPNGWTVSDALLHLGFWDVYAQELIEEWKKSGYKPAISQIDAVNAGVSGIGQLLDPSLTVKFALEAADGADARVASLAPELAAAIEAAGKPQFLYRSRHRNHHLELIEKALGI